MAKTPFYSSFKVLAWILFIVLPLIGFYVGSNFKSVRSQDEKQAVITQESDQERRRQLIKKCGDIPREKLSIPGGSFISISGPEWSPDCEHIAYSVFNSGTVSITEDRSTAVKGDAEEGFFLYTVKTEKVEKIIYRKDYESPQFERWEDSDEIVFSFVGPGERRNANYNIRLNMIVSEVNRL